MTQRLKNPKHRIRRLYSEFGRAIVPLRMTGGSTVITLPKALCKVMCVGVGDRVLLEYDPETQSMSITKDSESARANVAERIGNLVVLRDYLQLLYRTPEYGDPEWCKIIERILQAQLRHLRGEKLETITVPDEEGE